nr:MAG TPA: hypothetical protein [Caudoviricetes sp.]DAO06369.1 MAG TPA: hypothetical protein [Caudoviricetes sp.]DAP39290.1 MAG TPA: hypothetical protein [Caudoviricetes sp.]DAR03221.1 MAG TPA: hypothetical protein [Caudoviricetes sp.]
MQQHLTYRSSGHHLPLCSFLNVLIISQTK